MSRWEFMRQLEELLSDISPSEREEALQYYNDYFNDAGRDNEQEVIKALGSPGQVAQIVRDGLGENMGQGEFTENGFTSGSSYSQNAIIKQNTEKSSYEGQQGNTGAGQDNSQGSSTLGNTKTMDNTGQTGGDKKTEEKKDMPAWAIVLIVIGCIFLSPVILGLAGAALGAIVSVFAALFSLIFGFGLAMIILYIVAFALVIAGFGTIIPHPVTGIGLIGGGCICAAIGILIMLLLVFLVGKCIPGICQGISYIFKKLFGKKGGAEA